MGLQHLFHLNVGALQVKEEKGRVSSERRRCLQGAGTVPVVYAALRGRSYPFHCTDEETEDGRGLNYRLSPGGRLKAHALSKPGGFPGVGSRGEEGLRAAIFNIFISWHT